MQNFKITHHNFTGITVPDVVVTGAANTSETNVEAKNNNQTLQFKNGYYIYTSELGQTIVNDNNVRNFLDDDRNEIMALNFINYLKNNTNIQQFKEIFEDNKKLAAIFNEYYDSNVLPGNITSSQISAQLKSSNSTLNLFESTEEKDSYYIPFIINQNKKLVDDGNYAQYFKNCENETYEYKKYSFINNLTNNVVYGNNAYVNSVKKSNNLGFSAIDFGETRNFSSLLSQAIEKDGFLDAFNYAFQTISQFDQIFNINQSIITTPKPGSYLSINVMNLNKNATFFATNLIEFDRTSPYLIIPIDIKIPNNSNGTSNFIVKSEFYSTALLNSDFEINLINPSSDITSVDINNGYQTATFPVKIYNSIGIDETIVLSLRSGNTVVELLTIKAEETIPINHYSRNPIINTKIETKNRLMLRCFVDYNFNDNEMETYRNQNITVIEQ